MTLATTITMIAHACSKSGGTWLPVSSPDFGQVGRPGRR